MAISSAAQQAEINAFNSLSRLLKGSTAFAKPAGFETSFPDFGFRLNVNEKIVDLHIEYKADAKAQMGSMRDWVFDGNQFSTPDKQSEDKQDLIDIMNSSSECKQNGRRLLADFKKFFNPKTMKIYSGMLTIEKDQKVRRANLLKFVDGTKNYQLAKIDNADLGKKIISHYKHKFKKSKKSDADYSMLLMMIGREIFFIEEDGKLSKDEESDLLKKLGLLSIPTMRDLKAQLEVRIQPRGLSAPNKPVSIDVMASFRLSGKSLSGATVI